MPESQIKNPNFPLAVQISCHFVLFYTCHIFPITVTSSLGSLSQAALRLSGMQDTTVAGSLGTTFDFSCGFICLLIYSCFLNTLQTVSNHPLPQYMAHLFLLSCPMSVCFIDGYIKISEEPISCFLVFETSIAS